MHGLAGTVAVDPPFHRWPGGLEPSGDLADRPSILKHETGDF